MITDQRAPFPGFDASSGAHVEKASFIARWKAVACFAILAVGGLGWSSLSHSYNDDYTKGQPSNTVNTKDYGHDDKPVQPATKCFNSTDELRQVVHVYLNDKSSYQHYFAKAYGYPIGQWCTKFITDFSALFSASYSYDSIEGTFNEDISSWDTSNGVKFSSMFAFNRQFNQDISGWNVSAGRQFDSMLASAGSFDQDLSLWNVKNGHDFSNMFSVHEWDGLAVSSLKTQLNSIASWDVSSGQTFYSMFYGTNFGGELNLSAWNMSNAQSLSTMFAKSAIVDGGIGAWDVSSVQHFDGMFFEARKLQADLSDWNTSSGVHFNDMFRGAEKFSADLRAWNTSSGVRFNSMFQEAAKFDSDLSRWDMSNARCLNQMFYNASSFDQNLCPWRNTISSSTYHYSSNDLSDDDWYGPDTGVKAMFSGTKCVTKIDPIPLVRGPWCFNCAENLLTRYTENDGVKS